MKTLRLLTLLIIFCCAFTSSRAQWVTIPDTTFALYLQQYYPNCMNGTQMDTTCNGITSSNSISINGYPIKDLTGIEYFDNLNSLFVNVYTLTTIPAFPQSLTIIDLHFNQLAGLPALPPNLDSLYLSENLLIGLPALPSTLKVLDTRNNPALDALPALPPGLLFLNCSWDSLTTLPALPASLVNLNCSANVLSNLPALPAGLQILTCWENHFTVLPALNPSLRELSCGNAELSALPALPGSLKNLTCNKGSFANLPAMPALLETLDIAELPVNSFPALPQSLYSLSISNTQVSALPALPQSLRHIFAYSNLLTSLPVLPDSLEELICYQNQLSTLPALPALLKSLNCSDNQLSFIPELPDSMSLLNCSNNPDLYCLPRLTHIQHLLFVDCNVACLPNNGYVLTSYPSLNTLPLCDPFNANNCRVYANISGNVYHDVSADCIQQPAEANLPLVKVDLLQNGISVQQTYTTQHGVYSFETALGDYTVTIDTSDIPFDILCPVSRFDSASITALDSLADSRNFALQCKPGIDIALRWISPLQLSHPASFNKIHTATNLFAGGCLANSISGQLEFTLTGPARYIAPAAGAITPVVSGNTLLYTIADWTTVIDSAFDFLLQIDTTAPLGAQVCFDVNVTPTAGDNNPTNNHLIYCAMVVNSYDPNIKEVYPLNNVDVAGNHWLTYTVRFQNTGNAPARHIYITDTIDTDVNIETFQLLAYSFQPQVVIKGNAMRFNFANINLPDSLHDEPNSHGYVQYKVKVKDNATVGTVINNTAFIYFDFNAPVVTNTTTNTLTLFEGINTPPATATMQLYPNPANDVVMINLSDNLSGGTLTLSDVTGRSLNSISITSTHNQLNTSALSSGVYLITAVKGGARVVQRLVVSK